jgi:small basic protein
MKRTPGWAWIVGLLLTVVMAYASDRLGIEKRLTAVTTMSEEVTQRLDRIEKKLDKVLENQ